MQFVETDLVSNYSNIDLKFLTSIGGFIPMEMVIKGKVKQFLCEK